MDIAFNRNASDNFHYRKLRELLKEELKSLPHRRKQVKVQLAILLPILYVLIYVSALNSTHTLSLYFVLFALLGILAVLIFINTIHDAVHNNIFKRKMPNEILVYIFDIIGGNSYIWQKRHILLHHNYQNISGWDSDIEQAGLIKIYPHSNSMFLNRFQHWLIFLFYPLYLFNWILIRDFKDFFLMNRIVRKVISIPTIEYLKLIVFKLLFLFYTLALPVIYGLNMIEAFLGLSVMMVTGSLFAMLSLLTPHVNRKNEFPLPNAQGKLNVSWLEHQFITTNDITLNSWFSRNLMGNFNFHLSHHLFPNISSVYAPEVTKVIKDYAVQNGFIYRSYGLLEALKYHYELIKANALDSNIFEEDM